MPSAFEAVSKPPKVNLKSLALFLSDAAWQTNPTGAEICIPGRTSSVCDLFEAQRPVAGIPGERTKIIRDALRRGHPETQVAAVGIGEQRYVGEEFPPRIIISAIRFP